MNTKSCNSGKLFWNLKKNWSHIFKAHFVHENINLEWSRDNLVKYQRERRNKQEGRRGKEGGMFGDLEHITEKERKFNYHQTFKKDIYAKRKCNDIFSILKEGKCKLFVLYQTKLDFQV